jgi:phosphohistidine phosphatase
VAWENAMKLVLVRHAIAEAREEFESTGEPDDKRPLTNQGRKKMKRAATGLSEVVSRLDLVATSPLFRAQQTAEILAKEFDSTGISVLDALDPMHPYEAFLDWLRRLDDVEAVAAIGHEPHLSGLAAWLVTGSEKPFFEFKKGGAALLEFASVIDQGAAQLRWLLTPAQLRAIGD